MWELVKSLCWTQVTPPRRLCLDEPSRRVSSKGVFVPGFFAWSIQKLDGKLEGPLVRRLSDLKALHDDLEPLVEKFLSGQLGPNEALELAKKERDRERLVNEIIAKENNKSPADVRAQVAEAKRKLNEANTDDEINDILAELARGLFVQPQGDGKLADFVPESSALPLTNLIPKNLGRGLVGVAFFSFTGALCIDVADYPTAIVEVTVDEADSLRALCIGGDAQTVSIRVDGPEGEEVPLDLRVELGDHATVDPATLAVTVGTPGEATVTSQNGPAAASAAVDADRLIAKVDGVDCGETDFTVADLLVVEDVDGHLAGCVGETHRFWYKTNPSGVEEEIKDDVQWTTTGTPDSENGVATLGVSWSSASSAIGAERITVKCHGAEVETQFTAISVLLRAPSTPLHVASVRSRNDIDVVVQPEGGIVGQPLATGDLRATLVLARGARAIEVVGITPGQHQVAVPYTLLGATCWSSWLPITVFDCDIDYDTSTRVFDPKLLAADQTFPIVATLQPATVSMYVYISIYNANGQLVYVSQAGVSNQAVFRWDGRGLDGLSVDPGYYPITLIARPVAEPSQVDETFALTRCVALGVTEIDWTDNFPLRYNRTSPNNRTDWVIPANAEWRIGRENTSDVAGLDYNDGTRRVSPWPWTDLNSPGEFEGGPNTSHYAYPVAVRIGPPLRFVVRTGVFGVSEMTGQIVRSGYPFRDYNDTLVDFRVRGTWTANGPLVGAPDAGVFTEPGASLSVETSTTVQPPVGAKPGPFDTSPEQFVLHFEYKYAGTEWQRVPGSQEVLFQLYRQASSADPSSLRMDEDGVSISTDAIEGAADAHTAEGIVRVLYLSSQWCEAAAVSDVSDVLPAVWSGIRTLRVQTPGDPRAWDYWGSVASGGVQGFSVGFLVDQSSGRCGAWSRLFVALCGYQGVSGVRLAPIEPMDLLDSTTMSVGTTYAFRRLLLYASTATAQGNASAPIRFTNHCLNSHAGVYYDPSYGLTATTRAGYENLAIDGFLVIRDSVLSSIDGDGNPVFDPVPVFEENYPSVEQLLWR